MRKTLILTLSYLLLIPVSLACSMIPEKRNLETIDSNNIHVSLEFNRITKKCTIQSNRKVGKTYYNKYWIFNSTTFFSAYEQTKYPEIQYNSNQQEIESQSHEVNTVYDVKNTFVLAEFESIKNKFSKANISLCEDKNLGNPFDQLQKYE